MLWGAAALLPVLVNTAAHRVNPCRYTDAMGLSLMLLFSYGFYNLSLIAPPGQPQNMTVLPFWDLLALAITMVAWGVRPRIYKLALASLFMFDLACHAAFWLSWPQPNQPYLYKAALNVGFAMQVVTLAFPGGAELAGHALDLLSYRRRHHHHPGLG